LSKSVGASRAIKAVAPSLRYTWFASSAYGSDARNVTQDKNVFSY
jgi:hypothetical protein